MPEETPAKPLIVEIARDGDRATAHLRGKLVLGTTDGFYQAIRPLLPQIKSLVLDLADLTYLDSMGLGVVVRVYVSAQAAGVALRVTHVGKQALSLFRLTNLVGVLGDGEEHGTTVRWVIERPVAGSLRFETERVGTRVALRCTGPFVAGTAEDFYRTVRPLLNEVTLLLVDLSKVTRMDSAGLGILVRMFVSARHSGRELRVTHVGSQVRKLLTITHLLEVLGVK